MPAARPRRQHRPSGRPDGAGPGWRRAALLLAALCPALPPLVRPAAAQDATGGSGSGGGTSGGTGIGAALPGDTAGLALPIAGGTSVLPATGISLASPVGAGYTGNIRAQVNQALGLAPAASTPGLVIQPGLGVQELVTDNVYQVSRPRVADLVTTITPSVLIGADTQRVQASIAYAPNIQLYAVTGQQDQIDHELNAQATVTLVPDWLFLDLRGFATQQSGNGGFGSSGTAYYSQQNRNQTTSFSISPTVVHRIGDLLQLRAGYSLDYVDQSGNPDYGPLGTAGLDGLSTAQLAALQQAGLLPSFTGNSTISHREFLTLSTTPGLGRISSTLQLRGEQDTGTGVLDGAYRYEAVDDVAYALNRFVALLGRFGYQDLRYSGLPPVQVNQAVWGGGLRLAPNPSSAVVVRYGHQDGFDSLFLNATYALTARTRVFAGYSEGLTTDQEQIVDNLAASSVDQYGNTLDSQTAAPLQLGDDLLGNQNSLYHLRRLSATSVTSYDLDAISLSVLHEKRTLVSSGIGYAGYSDEGTSGTIGWSHTINEITSTFASFEYGVHSYGSGLATPAGATGPTAGAVLGNQQVLTLNGSLTHAFSPTLTGTMQYILTNQSTSGQTQGFLQNVVLAGLRKTF